MKVIKLQAPTTLLWEYVRDHCPSTLRATNETDGYGTVLGVEVKDRSWVSYFSRGIATVGDDWIELRHPEFFSDFEDLCRKYEAATGKEVTLRYWEGK